MPKVYEGVITAANRDHQVFVIDPGRLSITTSTRIRLQLRLDLQNHSPDGFCWGYGGSGPAQLALAILADCIDDEKALKYYQEFKADVIARLPMDKPFVLSEDDVHEYLTMKILKS